MTRKKQYEELVRRYIEDRCTNEELEVVLDLLNKGKLQPYFEKVLQTYEEHEPPSSVFILRKWKYLAAAAVITGLLTFTGLWYYKAGSQTNAATAATAAPEGDKAPGWNHARLTLSNGHVVDLDSTSNSVLQLQNGASLVKNKTGDWSYHGQTQTGSAKTADALTYNTLSAPRGGQFSFLLEDGTRVWLNAASSLRFPVKFSPGSREVTLTGEAYFEVARNTHAPFVVDAGNTKIDVLGTHFNVNAYTDEPAVRTTLVEGAVRVSSHHADILLHPGEQSSTGPDGAATTSKDPELVEAAVAWKEGYFSFGEEDIQTVMRQLCRWYNVDVRYDGAVTKATFGGDMGRDLTLLQVLKLLEKSGVHFRLDGNTITVLPS
jgi:transmembrane sensor